MTTQNLIDQYQQELEDLKFIGTDSGITAKKIFQQVIDDLKRVQIQADEKLALKVIEITTQLNYNSKQSKAYLEQAKNKL